MADTLSLKTYLSPKCPNALTENSTSVSATATNADISLQMTKRLYPLENYTINYLNNNSNYCKALWGLGELKWERGYHTVREYDDSQKEFVDKKVLDDSLFITYSGPSPDKHLVRPYWREVSVVYKEFSSVASSGGVVLVQKNLNTSLAQIPTSGNAEDFWMTNNPPKDEKVIITSFSSVINIKPGMCFELTYNCVVNGQNFKSPPLICHFETPLFTGGIIKAKTGIGTGIRYVVEIFGKDVVEILPTDFIDYEVGKWVYLLKEGGNLTDVDLIKMTSTTSGKKLDFGSSNITIDEGGKYRLVPFDFGGVMSIDLAVPSVNRVSVDMSQNFFTVFDYKLKEGHLESLNPPSSPITLNVELNDIPDKRTKQPMYLCPQETDTSLGGFSFKERDSVLTLNKGDDTWTDIEFIGHPKEVKHCYKMGVIVSSWDDSEALLYDIMEEKIIISGMSVNGIIAEMEKWGFKNYKKAVYDEETKGFEPNFDLWSGVKNIPIFDNSTASDLTYYDDHNKPYLPSSVNCEWRDLYTKFRDVYNPNDSGNFYYVHTVKKPTYLSDYDYSGKPYMQEKTNYITCWDRRFITEIVLDELPDAYWDWDFGGITIFEYAGTKDVPTLRQWMGVTKQECAIKTGGCYSSDVLPVGLTRFFYHSLFGHEALSDKNVSQGEYTASLGNMQKVMRTTKVENLKNISLLKKELKEQKITYLESLKEHARIEFDLVTAKKEKKWLERIDASPIAISEIDNTITDLENDLQTNRNVVVNEMNRVFTIQERLSNLVQERGVFIDTWKHLDHMGLVVQQTTAGDEYTTGIEVRTSPICGKAEGNPNDNDYNTIVYESAFLNSCTHKIEHKSFDILEIRVHADYLDGEFYEYVELLNTNRFNNLKHNMGLDRIAKDISTLLASFNDDINLPFNKSFYDIFKGTTTELYDFFYKYELGNNTYSQDMDIAYTSFVLSKEESKLPTIEKYNLLLSRGLDIPSDFTDIGLFKKMSYDGRVFYTFVYSYNGYMWAGLAPIDTTEILEHIKNNFTFKDSTSPLPQSVLLNRDRLLNVYMAWTPLPVSFR